LEKSGTLTVASGSASVPTGFFRLKRIVMPDGTAIFPQEIDVQQFDTMQHLLFTNLANTVQYYKIWNGTITFLPTPANGSYTFYYYGLPTTDIATAVEPEIPAYMDDCLRLGALADVMMQINSKEAIAKAGLYKRLYDEEYDRLLRTWRATKTTSNTVVYQDV